VALGRFSPPRVRPGLIAQASGVRDPATARALEGVEAAQDRADRSRELVATFDVTLATGDNTIAHNFGVRPGMVQVAPLTPSAAFGWGWDPAQAGNNDARNVAVIGVVGGPIAARVRIWRA
jgi:hypothetical protein